MPLHIKLHDDTKLPALGLGLWKVDDAADLVHDAIGLGYRHLDSACDYGNEQEVGQGIRKAIDNGLCSRDDLWITSKLWNTYHRPEHVRPACEKSLSDLGVDHLDLYLIHFPISLAYVDFQVRYPPAWFHDPDAAEPRMQPDPVPVAETWAAMEQLVKTGLVKHIGVANFNTSLLGDLLSYATVKPAMLQVELHPYLQQPRLLRFCKDHGVAVTGFSPLGAPSYVPLGMADADESLLEHQIITDIANQQNATPAQVLLRWGLQRGTAVIPKSNHIERLKQNFAAQDIQLTPQQMQQIDALDRGRRYNDPGVFCEEAFNTFCPIFD